MALLGVLLGLLLSGCAQQPTIAANIALQFPADGVALALYVYGPLLVALAATVVGAVDIVVFIVTVRRLYRGEPSSRALLLVGLIATAVLTLGAALVLGYTVASFAGLLGPVLG
ncbi:hypothetical protein [Amnibacterium kyonggiense]|uniref:Uncharacterized protein n=1 Tax=Amnibacterium kyonggiense TaxID=595671 RepID=A0A4R7FP42_9MICO|nr:hypothetical protein [Amnibacterium kyonggiense]TDS79497.1 hypothetical protein CLV52_0026 [Amnibacterium kyonggiense]